LIIILKYNNHHYKSQTESHYNFSRKHARWTVQILAEALPIRWQALHVCFPARKSVVQIMLPILRYVIGKDMRHRLVLHHGSPSEICVRLQDYSILPSGIPVALGGTFAVSSFQAWMDQQIAMEQQEQPTHLEQVVRATTAHG
jgi:hypothetical protein